MLKSLLSIKVDARQLLSALQSLPNDFTKGIRKEMGTQMEEVAERATKVHRFKTRSGNLERSVTSSVDESQGSIIGKVDLNPRVAIYGPRIHSGFGSWRPDMFLFRAFNKQRKKIINGLSAVIGDTIKKAGL